MTGVGDAVTKVGGLASGVSLAAFTVLPMSPGQPAQEATQPVAAVRAVVAPSPLLTEVLTGFGSSHLRHPTMRRAEFEGSIGNRGRVGASAAGNLAQQLKSVSGLGVKTLAKITGVSRTRYHAWLRGEGIGPDKYPHMRSLLALFTDLRPLLGPDMRAFVRSQGPTGRMEDLLAQGETSAVMGLALRPGIERTPRYQMAPAARSISGVPGWIQRPRRLAWQTGPVDETMRSQALDEFGASRTGPDYYLEGADLDDDGDAGAAAVHVAYGA